MFAEEALDLSVKFTSSKCRGAVAVLPELQSGEPPAAILHGKGIENRSVRADERRDEIAALVGGHCGIEKEQRVLAFSRELHCGRQRSDEGQLAVNFLKRSQERVGPCALPSDQQNSGARGDGGSLGFWR